MAVAVALLILARPAAAASPAPPPAPTVDMAAASAALASIDDQLPTTTDDARLADMGRRAAQIQAAAVRVAMADRARMQSLDLELRARARRRQTASERARRAALATEAAGLQAETSRMALLAAQADKAFQLAAERRREGFSGRVLEHAPSPLVPAFWEALSNSAGSDLGRVQRVSNEAAAVAEAAAEPRGLGGLAIGGLLALLLLALLRPIAVGWGWRRVQPSGTHAARRTLAIAWAAAADVAAAALAAEALRAGAQWGGLLNRAADQLARGAVLSVAWGAAVVALGQALGTARRSERRLLPIGDDEARRARRALSVVALITAAGSFLQTLNYVVGASVAATIGADLVISLAYAAAAGLVLASFGRDDEAAAAEPPHRRPLWALISLGLAGAIAATVAAALLGYTTLAALIASQVFWLSLVGASAFLASRLVDDLFGAAFSAKAKAAVALARLFGLQPSTLTQVGLLISAALQILIMLAAVVLALTPFGQSGRLLLAHLGEIGGDVRIGKIVISPVSIAGGIATLMGGIALAHAARAWVTRRYLPVTHWDAGVRNSVSTGVGYLGVAIALVCALAVTGVGLQQIALVASALSVGIGFGLQQIVQNFVAGIILLIERPVKVGDWISVSGVEGDVRDIRVRATEIATQSGSTVIVPNSSLITGNLENKTLGDPSARIQLDVTISKPGDVPRARQTILKLAEGRSDLLKQPAPEVYVLSLTGGGGANLEAWVHVADPRSAMRVRSELYLATLEALQAAGVAL